MKVCLLDLIFFCPIFFTIRACVLKNVTHGLVCVCNSTYCDDLPTIGVLNSDEIVVYTTAKHRLRFNQSSAMFSEKDEAGSRIILAVNSSKTYQKIFGIGGAITDSAGFNIMRLSEGSRRNLIESYFGESGRQP